jgi:hypothetical protein
MTDRTMSRRIAEGVIRRASSRLPADMRGDRCREWTAELPAILRDSDVRFGLRRSLHALRYAVGSYRSSRRLRQTATASGGAAAVGHPHGDWADRSHRQVLTKPRLPDGSFFHPDHQPSHTPA